MGNNVRARLIVAFLGLLGLWLVTGCSGQATETDGSTSDTSSPATETSGGEGNNEEVTLTFWKPSWGTDEEYLAPLFEEFETQHPGVTIEYLFHPWDGLVERYTTAFTGGAPPDVFYLPDLHYPRFADAGYLAELDTLFPDDVAALEGQYQPKWWAPGDYAGHRYGIPFVHVGVMIAYNKGLFDAEGLPYPPEVGSDALEEWNWESFVSVAQELTDAEAGIWGYAWGANFPGDSEVYLYNYVRQAGAAISTPDGDEIAFDNPQGLEAFEFMNDMATTHGIVPDGGMNPQFQDVFLSGNAAMAPFDVYQVIGMVNDNPELDIGVTPYPQGPGTGELDGRAMHANVGFLFQAASSENPDLAFELIKFLSTKEATEAYINATGLFGARTDYEMALPDPEAQELAEQILEAAEAYGFGYPIGPRQIDIREIFVAEAQSMLTGQKTPEEAWRAAADQMTEALSSS